MNAVRLLSTGGVYVAADAESALALLTTSS